MSDNLCPVANSKLNILDILSQETLDAFKNNRAKKTNLIWLEGTGCSGNIISLLDSDEPDIAYFLKHMVNLTFENSIMNAEGEKAFEIFLNTLDTEFILAIEGAVSTANNGLFNTIATYKGKPITLLDAVKLAGNKAKYVLAVGTCASFGGMSAASPNPSASKPVHEILKDIEVINIPGCPSNPRWAIGTIAHILMYGKPALDSRNRPILFYGVTIHDFCSRRNFFEKRIFAKKLGDEGCMFKLGCRGPVTRTDCPINKWNSRINWPVQNNTPCIGCANAYFPDGMEPFVRY